MKQTKLALIPVMFCFFAMGFVDLVGIASNYVKEDLALNDSTANIFPSLVFFWFLIFSVPTGMLMNKIGRKNTVLLSLVVTIVSLLLPLFGENFGIMLCAFSLLGIGNALMQTSADITQPAGFYRDGWRQPCLYTHLRTVYQGHRLIFGTISCHVGCYAGNSHVRLRLARALCHLFRGGYSRCRPVVCHAY